MGRARGSVLQLPLSTAMTHAARQVLWTLHEQPTEQSADPRDI